MLRISILFKRYINWVTPTARDQGSDAIKLKRLVQELGPTDLGQRPIEL